ncbi:MaoC/PaaZ C-terminal domain-containing protein [uncultured Albimonas sp.]|uniref:MaoC/PaaZ C-terminal domain-containing protein n=1 Tax=uncultured Albimonas sp. TaxID=1331701 RepID=UPI0030EEC2BD
MTFDADVIKTWPFEEVRQTYSVRDAIIYALGIGMGMDPLDEQQLDYLWEEGDFRVVPTMAVVLAGPGFWVRDPRSGVDWRKVLHGEQGIELFRPLPAGGTVSATTRVTDVLDKGADKGALIYVERTLRDVATGEALARLTSTSFARGNGGFGGASGPQPPAARIPDAPPDEVCDLPTSRRAALLYRLSGDDNPLHISPSVARAGGFEQPILHGLCTLGVAGHAILRTCCGYDHTRLKSLKLRFSRPVYPGETIRTEIWRRDDEVLFRARSVERDLIVLDNGRAVVA